MSRPITTDLRNCPSRVPTPHLAGECAEVGCNRAGEQDGPDMVEHPPHYTSHPSGVECIDVVEHMPFNRGNAIKYLWRAGDKGGPEQHVEDLRKAEWYVRREIERVTRMGARA